MGDTPPVIVSKYNSMRSRFSKTSLFSICFRRSMCTVSEKADRIVLIIGSSSSLLAIGEKIGSKECLYAAKRLPQRIAPLIRC